MGLRVKMVRRFSVSECSFYLAEKNRTEHISSYIFFTLTEGNSFKCLFICNFTGNKVLSSKFATLEVSVVRSTLLPVKSRIGLVSICKVLKIDLENADSGLHSYNYVAMKIITGEQKFIRLMYNVKALRIFVRSCANAHTGSHHLKTINYIATFRLL